MSRGNPKKRSEKDLMNDVEKLGIYLRRPKGKWLWRILSLLPPREWKILCMSYGIGEKKAYSLKEIAEISNTLDLFRDNKISRSRVGQIKNRAFRRLKEWAKEGKNVIKNRGSKD